MTEKGKIRHRVRVLIFRRGETRAQDELVLHVVTTRRRFLGTLRRLWRRFDDGYTGWVADEMYWREHGLAGRR